MLYIKNSIERFHDTLDRLNPKETVFSENIHPSLHWRPPLLLKIQMDVKVKKYN